MLCLARNVNQRVLIRTSDGDVWVTVMDHRGDGKVRLGVDAPESVGVFREELWLKMQQGKPEEGKADVAAADDANPGGHD
jgi:carbon storage regulator